MEIASETINEKPLKWYAIRTFNCQELKVGDYLATQGKEHFIPMTYALRRMRDGREKRILMPVVHNLIFLKKDCEQRNLLKVFSDCPVPVNVFRKTETSDFYEIPDRDMLEFRLLCDPSFEGARFITEEEAEARPGKEVRIVHGPFAGLSGKLHRANKEYFFIKTVACLGVMVRIPRYYCKVVK